MRVPLMPLLLELRVDELGHRFAASRVRGRETLSKPYHFDVSFLTTRRIPLEGRSLVGHAVTLTLQESADHARKIRGVVASQRVEGHAAPGDHQRFRVRVVPRLALLRHRVNSRIFQDRTVVEIVGVVLGRMGVRSRTALVQTYPRLDYCVQYRESDLDFVERILGEHGIHYYFDHPEDPREEAADADTARTQVDLAGLTLEGLQQGSRPPSRRAVSEVVVLCDRSNQHPAVPRAGERPSISASATLVFGRDHADASHTSADVVDFSWSESVRATTVTAQGYDFMNPLSRPSATVSTDDPSRRDDASAVERLGLDVYTHQDGYLQHAVDRRAARTELERLQRGARRGQGTSLRVDLAPGHRFALDGHPQVELNREYLVTEVAHRAVAVELAEGDASKANERRYSNEFRCIPADREFRPRWSPRPPHQVVETALVVGPDGEDVHTDALGRVKVRFPWDRSNTAPELSSCWVRVAQSWAGGNFGAQFIPRVGTEVLVAFLDGDADRPIVIGNLYNGLHHAPFTLPEDRTRSGWRTRSTPGDGHNELSFEDRAGAEELRVRAQRDLNATVGRDHRVDVRGRQTVSVGHDQRVDVAGSQSTSVGQHQTVVVGGVQSTEAHDRSLTVHHNQREEVKGSSSAVVHGAVSLSVGAHHVEDVAGDQVLLIAGSQHVRVSGPDLPDGTPGGIFTTTSGAWKARAEKAITLRSDEGLTLACGDTRVEILPHELRITSPRVIVRADDRLSLHASESSLDLGARARLRGEEALVQSSGAELRLDREALLRGCHVRLAGAARSQGDAVARESGEVEVTRRLTVSVNTGVHEDGAHAGRLLVMDGDGVTVDTRAAGDARRRDGALVFEFDPDALPDPVQMLWQDEEHTLHVLGPCSPRRVADDLSEQRYMATRTLVARKGTAARGPSRR